MARLLARIGMLYLGAYCLLVLTQNLIETEPVRPHYRLAAWLGEKLFGLAGLVSTATGSGDTTVDHLLAALLLVLAIGGGAIWSAVTRSQDLALAHGVLRVIIRYTVSANLFFYGFAKIWPSQFGTPYPMQLVQPVGEMSPMGLLWTFMAASRGYQIFGGLAEVFAGLLLLSRRTTLLGSLVGLGVMINVLALNLFYDVPVKLFAAHLVLLLVVLIAPDAHRLYAVLVRHESTTAVDPRWRSRSKTLNRLRLASKTLGLLLAIGLPLLMVGGGSQLASPFVHEVDGVWMVESFRRNGEITETERWKRLDILTFGDRTYVYQRIERSTRYRLDLDKGSLRLTRLTTDEKSLGAYLFRWEKLDGDRLLLEGTIEGETVRVVARRVAPSKMLLVSRGFHWISEAPFNR